MRLSTEEKVTNALKLRYSDHIFAEQVKLGSAGSKIIDAVAIKKTWSPITVIGFEIKVSRADFLGDNKYPLYMDACTNFYFVAPEGVIKPDEIPADVGLMVYHPTSGALRIKKKAPYLKHKPSPEMLLHMMFWKFDRYERKPRLEHLEDIKARVASKDYGHEIASKIARLERGDARYNPDAEAWKKVSAEFETKFGYAPNPYNLVDLIPDDLQAIKDISLIKGSIDMLHKRLFKEGKL